MIGGKQQILLGTGCTTGDASENPIMCHGFDDFLANGVGYRN